MTKEKKYTIARNHGEYCRGLYETRTQALQVWWSYVQEQFTSEEIHEVLDGAVPNPKCTLEEIYDVLFIDATIVEVYL